MRRLLVGTLIGVAAASGAAAQTIPLVAGEVTAGNGGHTRTAGGQVYLDDEGMVLVRLAVTVRLGGPGAMRPVLLIEHSPNMSPDVGGPAPIACTQNNNCRRFPTPHGSAVGLGLQQLLTSRLTIGAGAGVGFYQSHAGFGDVNASFRLLPHFSAVVDSRCIRVHSSDNQPLNYTPVSFGVRAY